jgi:hypothetical protein
MGIPLGHLKRRVSQEFFKGVNIDLVIGCKIAGIMTQVVETGGGDIFRYPG